MSEQRSFVPPQSVRNNARRGLELRRKHGRGGITNAEASKQGIGSGVQRASDLANGEALSYRTVKRMKNFFSRHSAFKRYHDDKTSAAYVSWLLWGGDAGRRWAEAIVRRVEGESAKKSWLAIVEELDILSSSSDEDGEDGEDGRALCDCEECTVAYEDYEDESADDAEESGESGESIAKARKVPAKYLEGLSGEERAKRKREIQERMESGESGGYKPLTGDDKKTKPSKYSETGIARRIRAELKGEMTKDKFLTVAARVSGVSRGILERCYNRGMAAWATGGHRPGASQAAWAVARVYSLISGGRTRTTADKDLWAEHLKNKRS